MNITPEQLEAHTRNAYARGFKLGAIVFGGVAVMIFVIMAHIIIYIGA